MKETVRAVHDAEVVDFFHALGLLKKLEEGHLFCDVCKEALTAKSFGAAARVGGEVVFCCDRPSCYTGFISRTRRDS